MIAKRIDQIVRSDIDQLVADTVLESRAMDYKRDLPGDTDSAKKELLADVCSFANTAGGDIIFGINEIRSAAQKLERLEVSPIASGVVDQAKLRIENIVRTGIAPRLQVHLREVGGWGESGTDAILVLRVPRSLSAPHMVALRGGSRFYARNSAGKWQLDVNEIRSQFLATEEQGKRVRDFLLDRVSKVCAPHVLFITFGLEITGHIRTLGLC